jgi:hypothetical protein
MKSLMEYFGCGNLLKKRETVHFSITKFTDLTEKIIPFFKKYPVFTPPPQPPRGLGGDKQEGVGGVKSKDFAD